MSFFWFFFSRSTYPSRPQLFPSLGSKIFGILAIKVFSAVHSVERPLHVLAFGDEERRFAVFATAEREDGVNGGAAGVTRYHWVHSQC